LAKSAPADWAAGTLLLGETREMKTAIAALALAAVLGAGLAAQAAPHHRHKVCTWHHHHRVCHWR
jgi:hypothetical protein